MKNNIDFTRIQGDEQIGNRLVLQNFSFWVGTRSIAVVHRAQEHANGFIADIINGFHFPACCNRRCRYCRWIAFYHCGNTIGIVALGKQHRFGPFFGYRQSGANHVHFSGDECREHGAKFHIYDLNFLTELTGHIGGKLHIKAHHIPVAINKRHGLGDGGGTKFHSPVFAGESNGRHGCRISFIGKPALHHIVVGSV